MSVTIEEVARLPHVASVSSPYALGAARRAISRSGRIAFATVVFDEKANDLPTSAAERVISVAQRAREPGLEVQLGGQAIEGTRKAGFGLSTAIGLLAAIVILLLTFGSVVSMGLPVVTALFGLGTGLGAIELFTHVVDTPNFSSELAAMIGLGVGIDYALFIVTRYREAYATPGPTFGDVRESVVQAMDTAGRAVLFAGATVVIALLGMMLLGVSFLYGVALAAALGVALVMLASLTLLPALMTLGGARLAGSRRSRGRQSGGASGRPAGGDLWMRWSGFVQRHHWAVACVAAGAMLAIAAPAIALRLGSSDASNDPPTATTHQAYELLAKGFGQGYNGPLQIVVRSPRGRTLAAAEELKAAVASADGVAQVAPVRVNPAGDVARRSRSIRAPHRRPMRPRSWSSRLRGGVIPPIAARAGVRGMSAG